MSKDKNNKDILNEEFNSLIESLKKCQNHSFLELLSLLENRKYNTSKLPLNIIQTLSNINTLLHSDPISVMSSVGNYNLMPDDIKNFQKDGLKFIEEEIAKAVLAKSSLVKDLKVQQTTLEKL